jgi:hypothetical protein
VFAGRIGRAEPGVSFVVGVRFGARSVGKIAAAPEEVRPHIRQEVGIPAVEVSSPSLRRQGLEERVRQPRCTALDAESGHTEPDPEARTARLVAGRVLKVLQGGGEAVVRQTVGRRRERRANGVGFGDDGGGIADGRGVGGGAAARQSARRGQGRLLGDPPFRLRTCEGRIVGELEIEQGGEPAEQAEGLGPNGVVSGKKGGSCAVQSRAEKMLQVQPEVEGRLLEGRFGLFEEERIVSCVEQALQRLSSEGVGSGEERSGFFVRGRPRDRIPAQKP